MLDDADLAAAVKGTINACFLNSGQTCSAHTRLLVPESKYDEAAKIAVEVAKGFTVGDPFGGTAKLGPLVSAAQRERVRGYIKKGIAEGGAELLAGGADAPEGLPKGYYVKPTIFGRVKPDVDHRAGRNLRPGAVHHHLQGRGRSGQHRQRHALRPGRRRVVEGRRAREARGEAHAHRPGGHQRRTVQPRRRSAATSSPATAANWAASDWRSSSNTSRCS